MVSFAYHHPSDAISRQALTDSKPNFSIDGVRRQAKRDAALESQGGTESTEGPSPHRSAAALQMAVHQDPPRYCHYFF